MKKNFDNDLPLGFDAEENLRIENQLLELNLKAEFGAETFLGGDFTADVENTFLKNALEIENSFMHSEEKKVCDILGNPTIKPEPELDDHEVELYLQQVNDLLHKHNIIVDFGGSYDGRTRYKFITEELFEECIFQPGIPGMMMHFIYEEFHPDHLIDLERKAQKFISAWFKKDTEKLVWELADKIILPAGSTLKKERVKETLDATFRHYTLFFECKHVIADINLEVNDDAGMAFAEGVVSYSALKTNQEAIAIQGPFKLYFCLEYGWWDICYFVFPGFEFNVREDLDS
jgi:hypothetical protein